jgi:hypothetical protein
MKSVRPFLRRWQNPLHLHLLSVQKFSEVFDGELDMGMYVSGPNEECMCVIWLCTRVQVERVVQTSLVLVATWVAAYR